MIGSSALTRVAVIAILISACAKTATTPAAKPPTPEEAYYGAVTAAGRRVASGDYSGADRILADYARKVAGTPEAGEVAFWRALYMVDPLNRSASMAEGIRALDIYLGTPGTKWYREPAMVLKRTALTVQSLRVAQQTPKVVGRDTVFVSREEEIAALRDQLSKANAELERIKKRLANPSR